MTERKDGHFHFDFENYDSHQTEIKCVTCDKFCESVDENYQCDICAANKPIEIAAAKEAALEALAEMEEERTVESGVKFDADKPDWSLLPLEPIEDIVRVLDFGAKKYDRDNWRSVPNAKNRYFAAAMRHLVAYRRGEKLDPESGLPHLAHAMCCLVFLSEVEER